MDVAAVRIAAAIRPPRPIVLRAGNPTIAYDVFYAAVLGLPDAIGVRVGVVAFRRAVRKVERVDYSPGRIVI